MKVSESQLLASITKQSFEDFVKEFWDLVVPDPLIWNWHMETVCYEMQEIAEHVFRSLPKLWDLVINVSPGSSKSSIASIFFPAWCWARMPHCKYIGASYAYPLALDLSRKCRDVIKSERYRYCFPYIVLRDDQDTKGYFANTRKGQRFATGSCGSVMGMHGHLIGIDDPLDPNRAVSEPELFATNNWIKETLSGRKVDRRLTPMILIMQRLHQNDPTELFLQKMKCRHICLPAELTDNVKPKCLRHFYVNGLMDPVRLPKDVLEETKKEMGPYAYAGQYEQSPVPAGGGMFNVSKLKFGALPKKLLRVARYWDKAGTAGKVVRGRGAFTAGAKLGIDVNNQIYILDMVRVRMGSFDRERLIRTTADEDGTVVRIGIEQEPGSSGKESAENTIRNLIGYSVVADRPTGDKEQRADAFSVQVNAGNVIVVIGDWNDEFVDEMRFFPYSTFKDQIDAAAGAFNMLWRKPKRAGAILHRSDSSADQLPQLKQEYQRQR